MSLESDYWLFELDGEPDASMNLSFAGGQVLEEGFMVGQYVEVDGQVRATIGEDVVMLIDAGIGNVRSATMLTQRYGDGPDFVESAKLTRVRLEI